MFATVNYIAVLVALLVYTILGMLWYGPLFGKSWMRLSGNTPEDMKGPKAKRSMTVGFISSVLSGFVAMLALAVFMNLAKVTGALPGLYYGAAVGFGFVAMAFVSEAAWNNTPWALVVLNSFYRIIGLALGGLIIGIW